MSAIRTGDDSAFFAIYRQATKDSHLTSAELNDIARARVSLEDSNGVNTALEELTNTDRFSYGPGALTLARKLFGGW